MKDYGDEDRLDYFPHVADKSQKLVVNPRREHKYRLNYGPDVMNFDIIRVAHKNLEEPNTTPTIPDAIEGETWYFLVL